MLVCAAIDVVMAGRGWRLGLADVIYWLAVLTLLGARLLEISRYDGSTSAGEPATMAHWRRHSALLLVVRVAVWGVAHFVAYVPAT